MHTNSETKSLLDDWNVIDVYTRENAIDDGVLVDVSEMAKEAGFKIPVAMTSALWIDCVAWSDEDSKKQEIHQDQDGRLWDVLYMAAMAAKAAGNSQCVPVRVYRVKRDTRSQGATMVTFKSHVGPGDQGEPVITLMLTNED